MHYNEFKNTNDKIIHLLVAALSERLYSQAIDECAVTYGIEVTETAVTEFKDKYASLIARFK